MIGSAVIFAMRTPEDARRATKAAQKSGCTENEGNKGRLDNYGSPSGIDVDHMCIHEDGGVGAQITEGKFIVHVYLKGAGIDRNEVFRLSQLYANKLRTS